MSTLPSSGPEFVYVSPSDLFFDENNPRFGGELKDTQQEAIQQYLMGKPHYASELVDSLLQNGFIAYEPLVVKRTTEGYIVLEGNRRLAAVKHILANQAKYSKDEFTTEKAQSLSSIPVLVFPSSTNKEHNAGENIYLGVRHLFGFREWPPLSKARFLHKEISAAGDIDKAVQELQISKQEVKRYLVPYRVLLKEQMIIPEGQDFWILGEALSRSGISKYINLELDRKNLTVKSVNSKKFQNLMDFLYGKIDKAKKVRNPETARIKDTRQLKDLAKALQSTRAAVALEGGWELELSLVFVETKEENLKRLRKILTELSRLLRDGLRLKSSKQYEEALLLAFRNLQKAANNYLKDADTNI